MSATGTGGCPAPRTTKGKTQGRLDMKKFPKIALGARAWGNDGTLGAATTAEGLRPVFEARALP